MIDTECSIYTDELAPEGSDWYYSLLVCNPSQKKAILVLLALVKEWERALATSQEVAIPSLKLQWWQEELNNAQEGRAQHLYSKALVEFQEAFALSPLDLSACLTFFMNKAQFPLMVSESAWLQQAQGGIYQVIANKVLNVSSNKLPESYLAALNEGLMIADSIIHLRHFLTLGSIPFAGESLKAFSIDENQLWALQSTPALTRFLSHYGREAKKRLSVLPNLLTRKQRKQQKVLLRFAKLKLALLSELAEDGYPVLLEHQHLTPIRKLLICWFG